MGGGKVKAQKQKGELDEQLRNYINKRRKRRKDFARKRPKRRPRRLKRKRNASKKQKRRATSCRQGRRSQSIRRRKCSRRKERNDQNQRAIGGREKDLPFHQNQTPRCR